MGTPDSDTRAVVVFARAPQRGCVKTRLAATLGDDAALAVYRALGERVVRALAAVRDCAVVVAHTPADAAPALVAWLQPPWRDGHAGRSARALAVEPQGGGDLGERMAAAIAARAAEGARRIVVVGTDCPALDAATVEAAFARLDDADVVLGPALDGGYYLVGVRRPTAATYAALFTGVPWSAPDTLAVTLQRAADAGLGVALLAPLRDVDTADDWAAWRAEEAAAGRGAPA